MIQFTISLSLGGQRVFHRLSWSIPPGERIGLIRKNGAGNSILLRTVNGDISPNEGKVSVGTRTSVGYLEQDVQALNTKASVIDETLSAFQDLRSLGAEEERLTTDLNRHDNHTDPAYEKLLRALDRVHIAMAAARPQADRPQAETISRQPLGFGELRRLDSWGNLGRSPCGWTLIS